MRSHNVRQGECLSGIAKQYGYRDYRILYDHPANAELKKKRPNPNLIFPGDVVVIPDKEPKLTSIATGAVHRFRVKRQQKILRIKFENAQGEILADHGYRLRWSGGGEPIEGTSNGDGVLEHPVPEGETSADLEVGGEERPRRLLFNHLNPLRDTSDGGISGVQARLTNLGYDPGPIDGKLGKWTRSAARAFAKDAALNVDDPLAPAFLAALEKAHGC